MDSDVSIVDDTDEDDPMLIAICPVSSELAAQIVAAADLDDLEAAAAALTAVGWQLSGDYLGDLGEWCTSPVGHLVYGDDQFFLPFAYQYWIHPDGVWTDDFWAETPGWRTRPVEGAGDFEAQIDSVVATFTELLGPPDHDVVHEPRPEFDRRWRYRAWRRADNVLIVGPGLDPHSYSQFLHAFVQVRPLARNADLPAAAELPNFCGW